MASRIQPNPKVLEHRAGDTPGEDTDAVIGVRLAQSAVNNERSAAFADGDEDALLWAEHERRVLRLAFRVVRSGIADDDLEEQAFAAACIHRRIVKAKRDLVDARHRPGSIEEKGSPLSSVKHDLKCLEAAHRRLTEG